MRAQKVVSYYFHTRIVKRSCQGTPTSYIWLDSPSLGESNYGGRVAFGPLCEKSIVTLQDDHVGQNKCHIRFQREILGKVVVLDFYVRQNGKKLEKPATVSWSHFSLH